MNLWGFMSDQVQVFPIFGTSKILSLGKFNRFKGRVGVGITLRVPLRYIQRNPLSMVGVFCVHPSWTPESS